jgi:hypothetical protein
MWFDHAVLVVAILERATRHFTGLGFTVTPGGLHAGRLTHNALIAFQDGAYLELLAPYRRRSLPMLHLLARLGRLRLHPAARTDLGKRFAETLLLGSGIHDFALGTGDLTAVLPQVNKRGLPLSGPTAGGRLRPDGQQVSWRIACPATRDLPFLIDDLTRRQLRVPAGAAAQHANQASEVAALSLVVADLMVSRDRYRSLLGWEPVAVAAYHSPGAEAISFEVGHTILTLEQASQPGSQAGLPCCLWLRSPLATGGLFELACIPGEGYLLSDRSSPHFSEKW